MSCPTTLPKRLTNDSHKTPMKSSGSVSRDTLTRLCDVVRQLAIDPSEKGPAFIAIRYHVREDVTAGLADDPSETVQAVVAWTASLRNYQPVEA